MPVPVIEAMDQIAHGRRIARHGPRTVVDWGAAMAAAERHGSPTSEGNGTPRRAQKVAAMKWMPEKHDPHRRPWEAMGARQAIQAGGSTRSAIERMAAPHIGARRETVSVLNIAARISSPLSVKEAS